MAGKRRLLISAGGPKLQDSAWDDFGESFNFAAFTNGTTATIIPISILPLVTVSESLGLSDGICRLQGGQIAFMAAGTSGGVAASSISTLGLAVYRSFCTLSAQITAAGGALTSLAVTPVNTALPSGQTFTLTTAAGGTPQVWTTSAAVAVGATSIPVSSATPSATYAIGTACVGQVGNNLYCGWLNSASGTPAFAQNLSVRLPMLAAAANPAINQTIDPVGAFLLGYPGDVVALVGVTSSSTFSVPAGIVSFMGV